MAATGFTPISLYYSTTASAVPTAGNLANGELALNTADMKLYAKNSSGVVTLLASNASTTGVDSLSFGTTGLTPSTATTGAITVAGTLNVANGGTGQTSFTAGTVLYGNGTSGVSASSNLFFDGSNVRLGIGTNSPATQFSVQKTSTSLGVEIDTTSGFNAGPTIRGYYRPGTAYTTLGITGSQVMFGINDVEKMRLDSSGRFGVGLTPTANTYNIQSSAGISAAQSIVAQGTLQGYTGAGIFLSYESTYGRLESYDYSTTSWKNIAICPNGGSVGVGTTSPGATIEAQNANASIKATSTQTGTPAMRMYAGTICLLETTTSNDLIFRVNSTERARLSIAGGWSVGTTADPGAGAIYATGNITAYYSSDIKFKENVRDIPDALATVNAIGGKLFDWTDEYIESKGGADGYFVQKSDFGVVAQDVQKVFPIAVRTRPDGSLAVDYEKLGALAFAALSELTKRVEALEAK